MQELLNASLQQQDGLRMLIHAMHETTRGKDEALRELAKHPVHSQPSSSPSIAELLHENARLKAENEELKKQCAGADDLRKKVRSLENLRGDLLLRCN